MMFKLPEIIPFKTLRDFIVGKGYSEQRYYKAKDILIENNKIIPYNNDHFLNLEKFDLPLDVERKILELLKFKFKDRIYMSKSQLQDVDIELNDSLMVTPEIIASVAKQMVIICLKLIMVPPMNYQLSQLKVQFLC